MYAKIVADFEEKHLAQIDQTINLLFSYALWDEETKIA